MTAKIEIQAATPKHAQLLAYLHAEIFPDDAWTQSWFEQQAKKQGSVILIAARRAVPVGLLVLSVVLDEGEILTLGVLPAARGRKVGKALLATALKQPVKHFFLEVAADNEPAIALYRSVGFFDNGRRPNYYPSGADAVLMMKTVA